MNKKQVDINMDLKYNLIYVVKTSEISLCFKQQK